MEVDFDKEIDALLRRAHFEGSGGAGGDHLDADQIAAFAENALPDKTQAFYTVHIADCDRCRQILSDVITLNAGSEPEMAAAAAAAPVASAAETENIPWYRKLFLFPNLAYAMGALVIVFSGFIAVSVIQNTGGAGELSQSSNTAPAVGAPYLTDDRAGSSNMSNTASANAADAGALADAAVPQNTANANVALLPAPEPRSPAQQQTANASTQPLAESPAVDEVTITAAPPPPPPASADAGAPKPAIVDNDRKNAASGTGSAAREKEKAEDSTSLRRRSARDLQSAKRAPEAAAGESRQDGYAESPVRVVSGRKFERKQNVWYDTEYRGQPTVNVNRGSSEFNKLDSRLRSIARSLEGTIVVVWNSSAYRIR